MMLFRATRRSLPAGAALAVAAALIGSASPALADVKAGVDAWTNGDYAAAVREWQGPAAQGDADAQFNMAQAYRLGRGVPADPRQAEALYGAAAAQGHIKAADNYGLLLFQDGRREQALPYVQAASDRGDPRAQYLVGVAHFNGDLVEKDWVRAYALLTLANNTGLPQARNALAQMDEYIPLDQRQEAQALAATLKSDAEANRARQVAAEDLTRGTAQTATPRVAAPRVATPRVAAAAPSPVPTSAPREVEQQASPPVSAGADYTLPSSSAPAVVVAATPPAPRQVVRRDPPAPAVAAAAPREYSAPPAQRRMTGPWKVRLGAFGVDGNAQRLWQKISGHPVLSGTSAEYGRKGSLTTLSAAGYDSRAGAQQACAALKRSGQDCFVTR